jgi:hypothetical protein
MTGLLPICAWCKKIRDEEGRWQQLEKYISLHSDTKFTHGLCKECAAHMEAEVPSSRDRKERAAKTLKSVGSASALPKFI